MAHRSKELLHLEHKNSSISSLESALLVCKKDSSTQSKKRAPDGSSLTNPVPQSQLFGKVEDFLGVISEANRRLELDAKDNPKNYDIEELTGNESNVIEMDLMLGVADLHTPDAVAAAESAVSNCQPVIPLSCDSSETDSDESSGDEDNGDGESSDEVEDDSDEDGKKSSPLDKRPISGKGNTHCKQKGNRHSKKRPKIVEL
ncbi:hypothetical protein L6164_035817 [Bauhinia variegata]|uniref:Uncharacterized protein n=1 Tax=Bauhinia variegata TaxID=167791 RepID=A0ACB9KF58_BAUVA|nr:hypothetical protein L6164_035817 [Bauhinia variegata]